MLYNRKYSTGLIDEVVGKLEATAKTKEMQFIDSLFENYPSTQRLKPTDK